MAVKQKLNKPFIFTTTFATYIATHILGEDGSGRIFEANDNVGGIYAIKWLDPAKATKEKIKRFKNELQFCSRNRYPNILTIIDHGVFIKGEGNSPFYVMPFTTAPLGTYSKPASLLIGFSTTLRRFWMALAAKKYGRF